MPNNDLISRAELIRRIDKCVEANYVVTDPLMTIHDIKALISILPTVDAVPIRHGYWIDRDGQYECSECHNISCCKGKYCTDCGAKMDDSSPTCGPDYCEIGGDDD